MSTIIQDSFVNSSTVHAAWSWAVYESPAASLSFTVSQSSTAHCSHSTVASVQWWANLKLNLTLKSQIFFTGDSNIQARSQILNRISHQNIESSNSKSQIKSQIPKQQKGFSKHISLLLVPVKGTHWNFHFRSSAFTCIDLAVQSLPLIITESELLRAYISDG